MHDERGFEILDDTPLEVPAGFKRPLTLNEQIQAAVRFQISDAAERSGRESFEDANDFDVPDEEFDMVMSSSEHRAMEVERLKEYRELLQEAARNKEDVERYEEIRQARAPKEPVSVSGTGRREAKEVLRERGTGKVKGSEEGSEEDSE